jgi:transcriptional regulator with XRE-family HTH domain
MMRSLSRLEDGSVREGEQLRALRERLGYTLRDVEAASNKIAEKYNRPEFALSLSRLSDLETKAIVPSIHKFYSLAVIYGEDVRDLMAIYGVQVDNAADDVSLVNKQKTQLVRTPNFSRQLMAPTRIDPAFDLNTTTTLGRMVMKWGVVPVSYLHRFTDRRFTYAFVGLVDRTMYPMILPGSFVQVDESKRRVEEGNWPSEYERPIYLVETREGYICSWCDRSGPLLTLIPHPLSRQKARTLRIGMEVEIVGQVVGIAMRLEYGAASAGPVVHTEDTDE